MAAESYPLDRADDSLLRSGSGTPRAVAVHGGELAVFGAESAAPPDAPQLIWAHGWGHSHANLLPLAAAMRYRARSLLVDLPGFGAAPEPPAAWSIGDYADAAAEWLADAPQPVPLPASGERGGPAAQRWEGEGPQAARRIWIGHSFGGRVGLQLAARHPGAIDALCLIATPGLPPRRSFWQRGRIAARRWAFRMARLATPEGPARERLRQRLGSSDYRQASPLMRQVLVKAVNEDLSEAARAIRIPVLLVYGDRDQDAPLEVGRRFEQLISQSRLVALRGFGHLDVLTEGRHQIVQLLDEFVERLG